MKKKLKEITKIVPLPLIIILLAIAPFYLTLGCPIQFFTGISCMGCGMSRAALALLTLDFSLAFTMHPLIFIMPVAVLVLIFKKKIPKRIFQALCITGIVLMAATYIYRLLTGSDVVYIAPESGYIYKTISNIFNLN